MRFLFLISVMLFPFVTYAVGLDSYETIQDKYKNGQNIQILLVPGHDDDFSGASFGDLKEADLTLKMAKVLGGFLSKDPKIKVTLLRDDNGYNPNFLQYFNLNKKQIMLDVKDKKIRLQQKITDNGISIDNQVSHFDATDTTVERLYGINSWIENQSFDLVIHIHFNDQGSEYSNKGKKYSGFSIYVPDQELLNATTSQILGDNIGRHLFNTIYKSNFPEEKSYSNKYGVIPDFYLIAMGSYQTAETPRTLIEYSYIYEPQLNKDFFNLTAQTLSRATASGIHDFLAADKLSKQKNLEYNWQNTLKVSKSSNLDVLALQYGLSELGFFPIRKMTQNECPFSGVFGNCTKKALLAFQSSNAIEKVGFVGPATRKKLNIIFKNN